MIDWRSGVITHFSFLLQGDVVSKAGYNCNGLCDRQIIILLDTMSKFQHTDPIWCIGSLN